MNAVIEWVIFGALSIVALVTAAGMIITMSMYRAGLALMASFVALAGLFILLDADLLAAIQVMMNVGGMLVMVLFMAMMMMDPGGEMMWGMKRDMHMTGLGAFSMHMPFGKPPPDDEDSQQQGQEQDQQSSDYTCPMHPEVHQDYPGTCPKCGMSLIPAQQTSENNQDGHDMDMSGEHGSMSSCDMDMSKEYDSKPDDSMNMGNMEGMSGMGDMGDMHEMTPKQNYDMMVDMAMSTKQLPWAIVLGVLSALILIALLIVTPWPVTSAMPTQDASRQVGVLLLSRYMIGFEGAAFLILAGIAGAVIFARREGGPKPTPRVQEMQGKEHKEHTDMDMGEHKDDSKTQTYTCPMHPEIRQQGPGTCPKCGMNLIPIRDAVSTSKSGEQGGKS
jgi:NADH-quinone oxidoreductase subunit J